MFGSVRPCGSLSSEMRGEYKKYYCGLCEGLEKNCGKISRFLVSYDVTMAFLVADSVYTDTACVTTRCPFNPLRRISYYDSPMLVRKLSAVTFLLACHKLEDDIRDEKSLKAKLLLRFMKRRFQIVASEYASQNEVIIEQLELLRLQEEKNEVIALEQAANPFAVMLQRIMHDIYSDELDDESFGLFCFWLGVWIYVIDAVLDCEKDEKKHCYNPLLAGGGKSATQALKERYDELFVLLLKARRLMLYALELLGCEKNKELILRSVDCMVPPELAKKMRKME